MSMPSKKLQTGAYVTDGAGLYEVRQVRAVGPGVKVTVEDCLTFALRELDMLTLRKFRLVRAPATGDVV
jgi:hypothetical protein